MDSAPLGTHFKSYELTRAINYYTLDPFQYSITKFDYSNGKDLNVNPPNQNGLIYANPDGTTKDIKFDSLLPEYTRTNKSTNELRTIDYHRFLANEGYFNPNEGSNNSDLWYYPADRIAERNFVAGPALNVQEVDHIIFPEAQRGGLDSTNLAKYSWTSTFPTSDSTSWESQNYRTIDNNDNCQFFNFNNTLGQNGISYNGTQDQTIQSQTSVYKFDSDYCRQIGINPPNSGSMPFKLN